MVSVDPAANEFRVLGPVEAVANGRPLRLGGRRQRALLALLVLANGRTISADRLADQLWNGSPPGGAATTLRSYVSRLRTALGDAAVVSRAAGYGLNADPSQLDVHRFEQLLRQGREALERGAHGLAEDRLRAALELWRGPALADVSEEGVLALEAARLDELRLVCVEARLEAALALGRHAELVPELERLVEAEPLREHLWRQLVLALYRAGRQADALAAYRRAHELLVEELGLEPSAALRELERAVLRHEVGEAAPLEERHNLPSPATSFVGREAELAELERLLHDNRLVTLTGMGGCGKTRLALEVAARQTRAWADGVWLVDLTALSDPGLVDGAVAATLGTAERPELPAREALVAQLRRSELLLVIDNCEHLVSACATLAETLLRECPNVRILATSRVPLGSAAECDYALDPLPVPAPTATEVEIEQSPAVRLFLERGRAVRRELGGSSTDLGAVAHICRELDGLPLAIELAAARAKSLSLGDIAARLGDRFRFLRAWRRIADPRHQTLQAAMDWSFQLLAEEDRALLRGLSAFAGGFTLGAAATVCLDGDEDRAQLLLGRLVDASLVRAEERHGRMRYSLLETVREYAAERLAEADELVAVRRSHAWYCVGLAEAARLEEPGSQAVDVVQPERGNIRAALDWCAAEDPALGLRLAAALDGFWVVTDPFEGMRRLDELLRAAPDAPLEVRARALRAYGSSANPAGRDDLAERAYAQSLDDFRAIGDDGAAAVLLLRLGYSAFYRQDRERARALAEESLAAFSANGNRACESQSLSLLGEIAYEEGDVAAGFELMEAGAALAGEVGFTWWRAGMLGKLVDRALEQGSPDRAAGFAREALALSRELGDRLRCVRGLARLAVIAAEQGDDARAGRLWGAVEAEEARGPVGAWESERERFERPVLAHAGPAFERGRNEGRRLSLDEAVSDALGRGA